MLSISTIKSGSGAAKYFEKDNYYLKDLPGVYPSDNRPLSIPGYLS